jgi:hypothetical protein
LLRGIATSDLSYVDDRLNWLGRLDRPAEADIREMETLRKRRRLWDDQLDNVNELLTRNEEALTQLEEVAVAIAAIRSGEGFATVNTTESVKRLHELADRIYQKQG